MIQRRVTLMLVVASCLLFFIVGLSSPRSLVNPSNIVLGPISNPGENFGKTENSSCAAFQGQYAPTLANVSASGWRPRGGIIDGQGCLAEGVSDAECKRCECDPDLSNGLPNLGPYYIFLQFTKCRGFLGGQLVFEHRGYNGNVILPLLLTLFLIMGVLTILAAFNVGQKWARKKVLPPIRGFFSTFSLTGVWVQATWGQCVFLIWLVLTLVLSACYLEEHARVNNLVGRTSRAFGGICVAIMSMLLLPAQRNSFFLPAFSLSFERALVFHRWMGALLVVSMSLHAGLMAWAYVSVFQRGDPIILGDGSRSFINSVSLSKALSLTFKRLTSWAVGFPHGPPLAGLIALGCVLLIAITASFRRLNWTLFSHVHNLYLVVYVMAFIHYPSLIVFCIPAMLLQAYDLLLRFSRDTVAVTKTCQYFPDANVSCIEIYSPAMAERIEPGHFIYLSVRKLSVPLLQESHPFSVSSVSPDKQSFTLHIKVMGGPKCWTYKLATSLDNISKYTIRLEGPYGKLSPPLENAGKHVVLVCGGVGLTPMLNILLSVAEQGKFPTVEKVTLIWTFRSGDFFSLFESHLQRAVGSPHCEVEFLLFDSASKRLDDHPLLAETPQSTGGAFLNAGEEEADLSDFLLQGGREGYSDRSLSINSGRPRLEELIPQQGVTVYVCGPRAMVDQTLEIAAERSLTVHEETFLL